MVLEEEAVARFGVVGAVVAAPLRAPIERSVIPAVADKVSDQLWAGMMVASGLVGRQCPIGDEDKRR